MYKLGFVTIGIAKEDVLSCVEGIEQFFQGY